MANTQLVAKYCGGCGAPLVGKACDYCGTRYAKIQGVKEVSFDSATRGQTFAYRIDDGGELFDVYKFPDYREDR